VGRSVWKSPDDLGLEGEKVPHWFEYVNMLKFNFICLREEDYECLWV
jgi:hypothetical protein